MTVWVTHTHAALVQRLLTVILLAGQVAISNIMDEFVTYEYNIFICESQVRCAGFERIESLLHYKGGRLTFKQAVAHVGNEISVSDILAIVGQFG